MSATARVANGAQLLGVTGAAKYLGISVKTFRDRIMPHVPVLNVSSPGAERQRRLFSVRALDETISQLEKRRAR